jgi:hypothetical protein
MRNPGRWQTGYVRMRRAPSTALQILTRRLDPETAAFAVQLRAFAGAVRAHDGQARGADGLATLAAIEACRAGLAAGGAWQPIARMAEDAAHA